MYDLGSFKKVTIVEEIGVPNNINSINNNINLGIPENTIMSKNKDQKAKGKINYLDSWCILQKPKKIIGKKIIIVILVHIFNSN